ncbi:hypothetical protein [Nocardioides sp.]|uniref:hypothetical protein n=1 Tax=Nocardioides sp. TaxID=35761 RepID=UPI00286E4245|nr:hypothetical protein [Nocardioides sp.]
MSITRPEARVRPYAAALATSALLLSVSLTACTGDPAADSQPPEGETADVVPRMREVLHQRARALRKHKWRAFLATVDRTEQRFVDRERVYFANLTQLPLGTLSYRVDGSSLVRTAGGYDAVIQVHLQLDGYDALPVVRPARFHFTHDPEGDGLLVASDRDRSWEQRNDVDVQPWDSGAVTVVTGGGVLGIFDTLSAGRAHDVIHAVEEGIGQVGQVVPYGWEGHVVVYALSDTDLLEGLDDLPSQDPDALDAVSFPVPARIDDEAGDPLAGTRFLLHPRMLDSDPQQLGRLIRHELAHVALGSHDDDVPTWLGEGIAEWVSVQPMPEDQRLISQATIDAAAAGLDELPADLDYNDADQAAHYGISWWACEAIVDMYGAPMLWRLLDELAATSQEDQDDVLQQTLQMGSGQLAREAAKRILATYG